MVPFLQVLNQNPVLTYNPSHMCYIPYPSHSSSFDHSNKSLLPVFIGISTCLTFVTVFPAGHCTSVFNRVLCNGKWFLCRLYKMQLVLRVVDWIWLHAVGSLTRVTSVWRGSLFCKPITHFTLRSMEPQNRIKIPQCNIYIYTHTHTHTHTFRYKSLNMYIPIKQRQIQSWQMVCR